MKSEYLKSYLEENFQGIILSDNSIKSIKNSLEFRSYCLNKAVNELKKEIGKLIIFRR